MWERWRSKDGTGAQQEMDESRVVSAGTLSSFVEMGRGGTGQGRDGDEDEGRVKFAEELWG